MKRYLIILAASIGLVGCAHDQHQGGTYDQSGSYHGSGSGGMASDPYYHGTTVPPSADRSPGANEHSPPPVSETY